MVPEENSYIQAHRLTEEEQKRNQFQKAVDNRIKFNRLMDAISVQNNPTPSYKPQNAPYVVSTYPEGGQMERKKLWDELTLPEQATMMKAAVSEGIFDLKEIRQRYNEFAEGGRKKKEEEGITNAQYINTMTWQLNEHQYKSGGGIHIKPSHRGRLTELKKRTGKSEAELYNDGNPAHKRMVVFARNARKWKHGEGGNLFDGTNENSQQMQRRSKIVFTPEQLSYIESQCTKDLKTLAKWMSRYATGLSIPATLGTTTLKE